MTQPTRQSLEQIIGHLDESTLQALLASGAQLEDITEAKALADGASDITGQGERPIPGAVRQALVILQGDQR